MSMSFVRGRVMWESSQKHVKLGLRVQEMTSFPWKVKVRDPSGPAAGLTVKVR